MALVFLLSHQRSGSHFLKNTLNCHNDHPDVVKGRERYLALPEVFKPKTGTPDIQHWLFNPFLRQRTLSGPEEWGNPEGIARAAVLFLDYLADLSAGQIVLVDVKLNQLRVGEGWYSEIGAVPRLLYELLKRGKVIFLRRKNLVRAVVSGLQATNTGVWHVLNDEAAARLKQVSITVRPDDLLTWVSQLEFGLLTAEEWLAEHGPSVLKVNYEDLFDERTYNCNLSAFDRIAEFVGLATGIEWQTSLQKIGKYRLSDVITNYDGLRAKMQRTKYAAMLDDSPTIPAWKTSAA